MRDPFAWRERKKLRFELLEKTVFVGPVRDLDRFRDRSRRARVCRVAYVHSDPMKQYCPAAIVLGIVTVTEPVDVAPAARASTLLPH